MVSDWTNVHRLHREVGLSKHGLELMKPPAQPLGTEEERGEEDLEADMQRNRGTCVER